MVQQGPQPEAFRLGYLNDASLAFSPPATRKSLSSSDASSLSDAPCLPPAQQPPSVGTPSTGEDCGSCAACLDKPKFGGPGIKRKGCAAKRAVVAARGSVAQLCDSVMRPPALCTPPLPGALPECGVAPIRGASKLCIMHCASENPSSASHATMDSEVDADPSSSFRRAGDRCFDGESPAIRKDYALRKRGAAAGEQIMDEADSAPAAAPSAVIAEGTSGLSEAFNLDAEIVPREERPDVKSFQSSEREARSPSSVPGGTTQRDAVHADEAAATPGERPSTMSILSSEGLVDSPSRSDCGYSHDPASKTNDNKDFYVVRLRGTGLERSPPGALCNIIGSTSSTPVLKTPDLEAVAMGGALGMSPLSEFASLLDMTPRLPEQADAPTATYVQHYPHIPLHTLPKALTRTFALSESPAFVIVPPLFDVR